MSTMTFAENEIIYDTDQDLNIGLSSEKVQALANSVYAEFERMMGEYGEDSIRELMPLIVTILESLDQSLTQSNENVVKLEMLKEDNDQLASRYEQERQTRKQAEQQLLEMEDINEGLSRETRQKVEQYESDNRHLELRCKNYADQIDRLQDRDAEAKKEYNVLRERHTEMIQSYMELIEKTKMQHLNQQASESPTSPSPQRTNTFSCWIRKEILMRTTSSPTQSVYPSPDEGKENTSGVADDDSIVNRYDSSQEHSLAMEGIPDLNSSTPGEPLSIKEELPKSPAKENLEFSEGSVAPSPPPTPQENQETDLSSVAAAEVVDKVKGEEEIELEAAPVETSSSLADSSVAAPNENSLFAELSLQDLGDVDKGADIAGMSKEVDNLIHENTKLLATKNALNVVKDDLIQQLDQLTTQHTLLKEELSTSEKSKTELQQKLDDYEKDVVKLQEEVKQLKTNNASTATSVASEPAGPTTPSKNNDDEEVLPMAQRKRFTRVEMARVLMERNQYKERLMELQEAVRWTETLRAARTLNEGSADQPKAKQKSSIFHFFHRLFNNDSNGGGGGSSPSDPATSSKTPPHLHYSTPVSSRRFTSAAAGDHHGIGSSLSMQYNAGAAKVMPRSKSTTHFYGRSPTIDSLRGGAGDEKRRSFTSWLLNLEASTFRISNDERHQQRNKDKHTCAVRLLDSNARLQACGWSLPNTPTAAAAAVSPPETNRRATVPVPVYCGPVFDSEPGMKLWCASAVNLSEGVERDGGQIIGAASSLHLNKQQINVKIQQDDSTASDPNHSTEVNKLDQELEKQRREMEMEVRRRNENVSSYVWLVASDTRQSKSFGGSKVLMKDACAPGKDLETFAVGSHDTHILCICSVPGVAVEDYDSLGNSAIDDADSVYNSGEFTNPEETSCDESTPATMRHEEKTPPAADKETNPTQVGRVEKVSSPVKETTKQQRDDDHPSHTSMQPTMWLGAQNGQLYVHSAVTNWSKCIHQIRLKDSVLGIVHSKGRVLAALADGTVAVFCRDTDGVWDLSNYYLLDLGKPHHSVRCMTVVYDKIWCGYRNKIHVVDPITIKVESSFDAHPRRESQVRQMVWAGDGVWVSIRLDSTIRLYHARTLQHLQDVDVEPYVSKVLGSGKLGFSFVRITSLMISQYRLWIGTGNGVVMSVPLSEGYKSSTSATPLLSSSAFGLSTTTAGADRPGAAVRVYPDPDPQKDRITPGTFIPYCSMANAQLSFHGYREAVKFFVAVPGCVTHDSTSPNGKSATEAAATMMRAAVDGKSASVAKDAVLVMSGGDGYVDFRRGGDITSPSSERRQQRGISSSSSQQTQQPSHMIVWQLTHS